MMKETQIVSTIDEYIASFRGPVKQKLIEMRNLIRGEAPGAQEIISYRMPAYRINGVLVYFAAWPHHIGFYPTASGIRVFKGDLSKYNYSKGAIQFPIDKPLPKTLIRKIVRFRVQEDMNKKPSSRSRRNGS
jgi:uncharacterized protein YdhG (YjbR/CyaY superfamily)